MLLELGLRLGLISGSFAFLGAGSGYGTGRGKLFNRGPYGRPLRAEGSYERAICRYPCGG